MLSLNWVSILFQIVNFVVFLYLLSRFLLKPLQARVSERAAQVEGMLDNAARREAESYATQRQIERRLAEVEREAEAIIRQAREESQKQSEALLQAAQERAQAIIARAQQEAEHERQEALRLSYDQMLDTIFDLASGVLRSVTVRQTHDDLVTNLAAYIWQRPPEEVREYRRALADREPLVFVYTPVPLTESQSKIIADTLSSLADRHVELEIQPDPSLIAGLRVRLGDRVIDNSLRRQLEQIREQVGQELRERLGITE